MTITQAFVGNMKLIQKPEPPFYAFCTHCRQQYLDQNMKWVDLQATYDGGVEQIGGVLITVDDVHLCENCAINVGKLVGMEFAQNLHETIKDLEHKLKVARGKWSFLEKELEKMRNV